MPQKTKNHQKACFVYIVEKGVQEAKKISRMLIQKKLAACINIIPEIISFYEWEGRFQESIECVLIVKTQKDFFEKLKEEVISLHSYSCPCIVMLPIENGHTPFLSWIFQQTQNKKNLME